MTISDDYGTAEVRRHYGSSDGGWCEVIHTDQRIAVSRDLLSEASAENWAELVVDGPNLTLCATHTYRATGETTERGDPIYELTAARPSPPAAAEAPEAVEPAVDVTTSGGRDG